MTETEQIFKTVQFNLPADLLDRMKKLSKIRKHSMNDEFVEALEVHLKEESGTNVPLDDNNIDASIEEQFTKNPELRKTLDKEVTSAVKRHLRKHTQLMK